ncbi:MAG: hypothetical protein GF405_01925 [Candidatus Eisenbacteria bacterium]|nr:hypothetical protein [Candidatus Eisenbacteria bacterium]
MRTVVILTIALVVLGAFGAAAKKPVDPVSGSKGLLDCTNALEVFCGDVVSGTTIGGPMNVTYYSCSGWDESGPEMVYFIDLPGPMNYDLTANISDLAVDLDVFILGSCDEDDCIAYGSATATANDIPAGTYYIVVDGYNGVEGDFTLSVDCFEQVPPCCPFPYDCFAFDFNLSACGVQYMDCGLGPNPWAWGVDTGIPQVACDDVEVTNILGTTLNAPYPASVGGIAMVGPVFVEDGCDCLELCHYYDTEFGYDGGNVKVSADGGVTWTQITPARGYDDILDSTYYIAECVADEWVFTGDSGTFIRDCFDLTEFIGQEIMIGLFFGSESYATSDLGWYVKWIKLGGEASPVEDTSWGSIKSLYR